jgi:hypothetical protein
MSVKQIIHQIDEVIRDTHTPQQKKIESLQHLAMTCWQEVVPEYKNAETYNNLEPDEMQARWANIRDEVKKYGTKAENLYVLDWPASGGNFYWVK